ncbi:hypothetical protein JMJ77_0010372 [Colletotrichum scovillei]|uniref:Uncharacterized protein n=1 Tax=Colletotrichum scovillei TaxID=1209932 RepID=A0A9P7QTH3_9PEZI|nr:hypothetical protein JMJ78_0011777 [Colletotrichum scovillei]KAG7042272.1 hypothetical protein JMJ77_0010372 [Colletotrichum scovillei]KAG7062304.1 hypothetical protein JMJ76_0006579 [Colletotrichum scovillei]
MNIVTWLQCDVPDGPYISLSLVAGTVETTSTLSGPVCGTGVSDRTNETVTSADFPMPWQVSIRTYSKPHQSSSVFHHQVVVSRSWRVSLRLFVSRC